MRCCCEKIVGQVEDVLEFAVPRDQMLGFVEHGDAVAHVLEGDAEFFLALADFVEQPRILHRDHRLGGKVLQQGDLLVGERPNFLADRAMMHPKKRIVLAQAAPQQSRVRTPSSTIACEPRWSRVGRICPSISLGI